MKKPYLAGMRKLLPFAFLCFTFLNTTANSGGVFVMPEGISPEDYLEGKIIFKMKKETAPFLKADAILVDDFELVLKELHVSKPGKMFPNQAPPTKAYHSSGQEYSDLSRIYHIDVSKETALEDAINRLYSTGLIEYAQPWYIPALLSEPNDPFMDSQYYLQNIAAYDAWSVEPGDSSVVIAIIDTGIDIKHPDLINNICYNYFDPVNGFDSDNDGYIDNFNGWDLGDDDNDPQWDVNAHGVHVAGIAGASTNNGTGMAGVGYNSRILPIKISDPDGRLVHSYEAIVYAADQGAGVINCSWGGAISPGQFGQDIINYAVLNKDAVVIAAAGNSNNQVRIYPASYINVVSVAATDINDVKWSGSSYGKRVDLSAPGANIFSTWPNGSYVASNGTSMAAPVVSGASALLRAHFPDYSALQIAAQLKVTTDLIDTIAANTQYAGLMGTGRLNIYRALTETHHPYLMFTGLQHPSEHYQMFQPGETFELGAEFLNMLASAQNMHARLSTQSQYIEIVSDESLMGEVVHNQKTNNFTNPFVVKIKENIPPSHEEIFTINFFNEDSVYAGHQNFSMTFNLDYIDFAWGNIQTTLNSKGNIGYNYPNYNQGVGFLYASANQNRSLISCAGLIAGVSSSAVVDNIYGPVENSFSNSFFSLENVRRVDNPEFADFLAKGSFNDSLGGYSKLGIKVDYRIYALNQAPLDKFLILEYDIINPTQESLPGLYVGYYADWIIQDVRNHRASFDPENRMGYAFSANGGNFTALQLLSHSSMKHYAFDNQGFGGSLKINDGFTSFEKFTAMKSSRENAGFYDKDNNVSTLISTGPFNLPSQDTLKVAFAILAGDHLNDLQANAQLASLVYHDDFTSSQQINGENPFSLRVFPNPVTDYIVAEFNTLMGGSGEISVYSLNAKRIYHEYIEGLPGEITRHSINMQHVENGMYIIQLKTTNQVQSIKILKH